MALPDIRVLIRNSSRVTIGEIDNYQKLTLIPRFNAVGDWTMELNNADSKAPLLDPRAGSANPGCGIQVYRNGTLILSGPVTHYGGKWSQDTNKEGHLTVSGFDDNVALVRRLTWPAPASTFVTQPGTTTTAFYTITGATLKMETIMRTLVNVQAGPGARTERQTPGLVLGGSDQLRGTATAYRSKWRFETLLEVLQDIAKQAPSGLSSPIGRGGLGFRVAQVGTALEFQVYDVNANVNLAKFSSEFGNLIECDYSVTAPETTFLGLGAGRQAAFTAGPSLATNLYAYDRTDDLFPLVRAEAFEDVGEVDPASADAQAQLDAQADQHFDTRSGQIGATFKLINTEGVEFQQHWKLGDYVQGIMPQLTLTEQVRSIQLDYDADGNEQIEATIGTVDGTYQRRTPGLYRRLKAISTAVAKLEVRQ